MARTERRASAESGESVRNLRALELDLVQLAQF
jgi:hypothetical protein